MSGETGRRVADAAPPARAVRIGLMRHFEVTHPLPTGWVAESALHDWREAYDRSAVIRREVDLGGVAWQRCYSSDVFRAVETAKAVHGGLIVETPLLREPRFALFQTGRLRLPLAGWKWMLRLAWLTSHRSQRAAKEEFETRLETVMREIVLTASEDTLIVCHAGIMSYLRKHMLRAGCVGPNFGVAEPGRIYVFEHRLSSG